MKFSQTAITSAEYPKIMDKIEIKIVLLVKNTPFAWIIVIDAIR